MIQIGDDATICIKNEFVIGDDVRIAAFDSAEIYIGGRNKESASELSGNSILLAHTKLVIGFDVLIAWDVSITDSDWHPIEGMPIQAMTHIGDHAWLAVGVKILKGTIIGNDSIVCSGAVVSGGNFPLRSLRAVVPSMGALLPIPAWHRSFNGHA